MKSEIADIQNLSNILLNGIMQSIQEDENTAFIEDKVNNIVRTRITAELLISLINLHKLGLSTYDSLIKKFSNWIITQQNTDGSWNEIHSNYNKPSSVFTSICGLSLLNVKESFPSIGIPENIFNIAGDFLLKQEISNGHFRKSELYHADVLNADAMVAVFLMKYGLQSNNEEFVNAAKRAVDNICKQQYSDGAFPYGSSKVAPPYKHHLSVPCIHYQTVTLFYLKKFYSVHNYPSLNKSIKSGIDWLMKQHNEDGSFKWRNSGLNFALYLTATHAFSIPLYFHHLDESSFSKFSLKSIKILKNQLVENVLLRWEKGNFASFLTDLFEAPSGGSIGNYPISYKILRIFHRIHRGYARAKISNQITVSNLAKKGSSSYSNFLSTVESSTNYPDLYMSTEALEALTTTLIYLSESD